MNEISCGLCMDLMPLVNDGVAGEDSRKAVEQHIKTCDSCRAFYGGERKAEADEEKAALKVLRKIRTASVLLLAAGVFVGLLLTELFMTGLSAIFAVLGVIIVGLLGFVCKGESGGKKKTRKIFAFLAATALITGTVILLNALFGNPVSQMRAERAVGNYLEEQYPGKDYYAERVTFNFKMGEYYAPVRSAASIDSHFEVAIDSRGNILHDDYESRIPNGKNTAERITMAYRDLTDPVLKGLNQMYTLHIGFGEIEFTIGEHGGNPEIPYYSLNGHELQLDGQYDLNELGAQAGHLIIDIRDDTVSAERAAEILLDIKERMEDAGIAFHTIDFHLHHSVPEGGSGTSEERIDVLDFLYTDIYEEGMTDRVRAAHEEAVAYYNAQDAER